MTQTDPIATRRVFYIPGYDPIPARRYRELYRSESAAQAEISGYEIEVTGNTDGAHFGWNVSARVEDRTVAARIDVLVWSDIVKQSMSGGIAATYGQLVRTAWVYCTSGALFRLMRLRKGPLIAALYPVGMLLGQLLVAYVLGAAVLWGVKAVLAPVIGLGGEVVAAVLGIGAFSALLWWFRSIDGKLYAYYLMHDYAYGAATQGAYAPDLETRLQRFADTIKEALASDADEVLVVGHSSGAHLAVSVLADLERAGQIPEGARLGVLTLGQVVPMISFLPKASRLRRDLAALSVSEKVTWVDISAPGDGCSFALCDPVSVSGVAPEAKRWPLVISAAFTQSLSPERWKALRRRFFRLHFQYLCAFDRPRDYDYFQITAGPVSLADRYAGRAPSPSVIHAPVSGYRDMSS